jgi:hypothetical protein
MDTTDVITQEVFARCAFPTGDLVGAELGYAADEPYAVLVTLHDEVGTSHEVARTLLAQAITRATGAGDVRAWPVVDDDGRSLVVLHLRSGDQEVVLELLTTQLDRFLGRTLALVPFGTESEHVDVDAVVARLLSSGAA